MAHNTNYSTWRTTYINPSTMEWLYGNLFRHFEIFWQNLARRTNPQMQTRIWLNRNASRLGHIIPTSQTAKSYYTWHIFTSQNFKRRLPSGVGPGSLTSSHLSKRSFKSRKKWHPLLRWWHLPLLFSHDYRHTCDSTSTSARPRRYSRLRSGMGNYF